MATFPEDTTTGVPAGHGAAWSPLQVNTHDPDLVAADLAEVLAVQLSSDVTVLLRDEHLPADPPRADGPRSQAIFRLVATCQARRRRPAIWIHRPGKVVRPDAAGTVLGSLRRGEHVSVDHVDAFTADHLAAELGEPRVAAELVNRHLLVVPIIGQDHRLAGYARIIGGERHVALSPADVAAACGLARSASRFLGGARGGLPSGGVLLPGAEVHARHQPFDGGRNGRGGGDWCDAFLLHDGRIALVIGDVVGHGARAAEIMRRCANLVGALAAFPLHPDAVVRELDQVTGGLDEHHLATCAYLVYDPDDRTCRLVSAGHPPPILIQPDGTAAPLDLPANTPIGLGLPEYRLREFEVREVELRDGSILVLYTDGLIEHRGRGLAEGLAELRGLLDAPAAPLPDLCDAVISGLVSQERQDDDATLLVARFTGRNP
ncbi:PP2C family protein-serine/threonine phosphatase [Spirillospora sp. NPDC047279]|uniref:PP2C family protein-serine/threonine phosphatase n=1 Tax=Spirillospora sp. NPDC047279 TaxID=3155478 RepID=UPI003405D188